MTARPVFTDHRQRDLEALIDARIEARLDLLGRQIFDDSGESGDGVLIGVEDGAEPYIESQILVGSDPDTLLLESGDDLGGTTVHNASPLGAGDAATSPGATTVGEECAPESVERSSPCPSPSRQGQGDPEEGTS